MISVDKSKKLCFFSEVNTENASWTAVAVDSKDI